jgi:hypothetical protein
MLHYPQDNVHNEASASSATIPPIGTAMSEYMSRLERVRRAMGVSVSYAYRLNDTSRTLRIAQLNNVYGPDEGLSPGAAFGPNCTRRCEFVGSYGDVEVRIGITRVFASDETLLDHTHT